MLKDWSAAQRYLEFSGRCTFIERAVWDFTLSDLIFIYYSFPFLELQGSCDVHVTVEAILTYHVCSHTPTHRCTRIYFNALFLLVSLCPSPSIAFSFLPLHSLADSEARGGLEGCEWSHCAQRSERVREIQCQGQSHCGDGPTAWQHRPTQPDKAQLGKEAFRKREREEERGFQRKCLLNSGAI